jgi:hypothetical protein
MSTVKIVVASATVGALVSITASALAGSGVGGVFNLGVANTVNAESTLTGDVAGGPQLRVENATTTQNAFAVLGRIKAGAPGSQTAGLRGINSGTNGNGFGVWGFHQSAGIGVFGETGLGTGVLGRHTSSSGTTPGVLGETVSGAAGAVGVLGEVTAATPGMGSAGVSGLNAAAGGYGVFGENTGTATSAVGVFGKSAGRAGILGEGARTGGTLLSSDTGVYACATLIASPCSAGPNFIGTGTGGFFRGIGDHGIGVYGCGSSSGCALIFGPAFGGQFSTRGDGSIGVSAHADDGTAAIGVGAVSAGVNGIGVRGVANTGSNAVGVLGSS